jgi:hypothetical protein
VPTAEEAEHDWGPVLKTIESLSGKLRDKISAKQNEKGLLARLKWVL